MSSLPVVYTDGLDKDQRYYRKKKASKMDSFISKYGLAPIEDYITTGTTKGQTCVKIVIPDSEMSAFMRDLAKVFNTDRSSNNEE